MSGKTANKKDVKPLVISGTSPKPHLKDDPINMSNTHEYVMQYTGIMQFIAINILSNTHIQICDAIYRTGRIQFIPININNTQICDVIYRTGIIQYILINMSNMYTGICVAIYLSNKIQFIT